MEVMLLKQQLEFMQFEIDDLKARELQQKSMYETMIKSLTQIGGQDPYNEAKELKDKHVLEIQSLEYKYTVQIQNLERKNNDLESKLSEKEGLLNDKQGNQYDLNYEKKFQEVKCELEQKIQENIKLQQKILEDEQEISSIKTLKEKIIFLTNQLENIKDSTESNILLAKQQCNKDLEELKSIYEKEKSGLQEYIDKLLLKIAKYTKGNITEELEDALSVFDYSKTIVALKSYEALKLHISSPTLTNYEIQTALHSLLDLYQSFIAFEQNKIAHEQERIIKATDSFLADSFDSQSFSTSELQKSRRLNEQKNENESILKPPIHSKLKLERSRTLFSTDNASPLQPCKENQKIDADTRSKQTERMIMFAASMECEFCKYLFPTSKFYDHLLVCMNEGENLATSSLDSRPNFQKVEKMEQQINELKLALGKIKNQRDKSRIAADKLLLNLKKSKLEFAVAEENSGEKQMELKNEIKNLLVLIHNIKNTMPLPQIYTAEIDQFINKSCRFFGGKLSFKK